MPPETPDYMRRIWLAEAPAGVRSSGPAIILDFDYSDTNQQGQVEQYRNMGWTVRGPYILQEENE